MRSLLASTLTTSLLLAGLMDAPATGTSVAGPASEEREILAQCETSMDDGPRIITNIAPIRVSSNLRTPREIREQIQHRAAGTMRKLGMKSNQNVGCGFTDPNLPWEDGNNPREELLRFQRTSQALQGYKVVEVGRLDQASALATDEAPATPRKGRKAYFCDSTEFGDDRNFVAAVESDATLSDITSQWIEALGKITKASLVPECRERDSLESAKEQLEWYTAHYARGHPVIVVPFTPASADDAEGQRQHATVSFANPDSLGKGYVSVSFEVEYQFIVCDGELHIAYSVVDDSVRQKKFLVGNVHEEKQSYYLEGRTYSLNNPPPTAISSVALKGKVWPVWDHLKLIGKFGDNYAGKALGFGCFSGQTQKVAKLANLTDKRGKHPTKEDLKAYLADLRATFETPDVLTSTAAEAEIRKSKAEAGMSPSDSSSQSEPPSTDADMRAARKAQADAEFEAKQKAYEEGMAAHQAAVDQYQKALADAEAQKAAGAARAQVEQEAFARKQAAYEAEAARARKAQADYEATYGKPK